MKKETRGRKTLPKSQKRTPCNFTVSPEVRRKLALIKKNRSQFFDTVLSWVPMDWIKNYDQDPREFAKTLLGN